MSTNGFDVKHRSRPLLEGPSRAGARAQLKGIGYDDEALAKPIIGVASTWIETMPCNFHLRALAAKVKEGIRDAGGTPMELNTVAISDGITMGTTGMKTSLVSREVIADSIELVARGHLFDGVVALSGCDKTIPGTVMALCRLDVPSVMLYGGSIPPGHFHGNDVTIRDVFEAIGAHATGRMSDEELRRARVRRQPGRRRVRRPVHRQHDGDGLRGARHLADGPEPRPRRRTRPRPQVAYEAGKLVVDVLKRGLRPERHHHQGVAGERDRRRGLLGRLDQRASCTCWRWPARSGVELDIDDFDRISERTPLLCDLKPGGRYVAVDLYEAGGVPVMLQRLAGGRPAQRGRDHRHRADDRRARRAARPRPRASASCGRSTTR